MRILISQYWQYLSLAKRAKWLLAIGRDPFYKNRLFKYLPQSIRQDLSADYFA